MNIMYESIGVENPEKVPETPLSGIFDRKCAQKSLCAKLLMFKMMKNRGENILKKV